MPEIYTTELPEDYHRLVQVDSFDALSEEAERIDRTGEDVNVILWRRGQLAGDFNALAKIVTEVSSDMFYIETHRKENPENFLSSLEKHPEWDEGIKDTLSTLEADVSFLNQHERQDVDLTWLDSTGYENVIREVCSFHADLGNGWRTMCCYTELTTQWIKNEDVTLNHRNGRVDYKKSNAPIYMFEPFDVWLHATTRTETTKEVKAQKRENPFVHRAPPAGPRVLFVG